MKSPKIYFSGLLILFLLAACAQAIEQPTAADQPQATNTIILITQTPVPNATTTPTQTITPIPQPTRRATPTIPSNITITTTLTPLASFTVKPTSKVTRTQTGTITPTNTLYVRPPGFGLGPTWTSHPIDFACSFVDKYTYPDFGQVFTPRADFVAIWKVINTGGNMWHVDDIIFDYVGGTKMNFNGRGGKILDHTIYVNDAILIQMHMKPPAAPGMYTTQWGFRKTNKKEFFCILSVTIEIRKQPK